MATSVHHPWHDADREMPSPPSHAPARSEGPVDGDVVIGSLPEAPLRFGLRQLPHEYQFASRRINECVALGRRFATAHHVDVWSLDTSGRATLIERNRLGARRRGENAPPGARWPPRAARH